MKLHKLALFATVASLAFPAMAQETSAPEDADTASSEAAIIVTGSRIKRDPNNSPLPLTIITPDDITREGINSPEQLISFLTANGNGADNLASNSDVVSGAARGGNNGLSAANLRGQGAGSTLVLLNGRRVASHGIGGGAVDVNQIPFAAIERIEVLEDGASAIYGTDAIGGVINFITKSSFQGVALNGFVDITQEGDSPIYRLSGTAGYGDLDEQGFNIMGAVSKSWNGVLYGRDRDFVNGNQPNRGLSVDTRGTPIATMFAQGVNSLFAPSGSLLSGVSLIEAGATTAASGGINILDLPGGAGCDSMDGGMAYDEVLWSIPGARYACAWDTGRAATLQQPLETLTYYGKATVALGDHKISAEVTGSNADSAKRFSNNQYTGNTGTLPLYYPLNATTAATYNDIYNRLLAVFPGVAANYGRPIAYRFRCIACGPREYETNSKTFRAGLNIEGPLGGTWDYRAGGSYAKSETSSVLGSGYHYRGIRTFNDPATAINEIGTLDTRAPTAPGATAPGIVGLLNSGILNPFSLVQSDAALAALDAISAEGVTLYGGQYEVKQFDASISGSLFDLPGGAVQVAIGADYRRETYSFNGSAAAVAGQPDIFNVAFDNVNALTPKNRTVKALYGEVLIPVFEPLEFTAAVRLDDYSGFGTTINPKFSAKFRPFDWLMFRGSYNTGFRVPAFNQIFNGVTQAVNPGNTLTDPTTCPAGGVINVTPGCAQINPDSLTGGNLNLGPETSEQFSVGVVLQPSSRFSASADFWSIAVDDTIGSLSIRQLLDNIADFPDRVVRTGGIITLLDLRADNIGSRRTKGMSINLKGGFDALGGSISMGLNGTYLIKKREKFLPASPYGPSLVGVFTYGGDLGLKWKHNAYINYVKDDFTFTLSQIYRNGYKNNTAIPGSTARPDFNERVKAYVIYNMSLSKAINEKFKITGGIKNVFNTDPPFAITYDSNSGAGSSWEPRVADPRGRSFTLAVEAKF
ncbi:MAG: TonB-dependent receptor [Sphingomonadales bacterium]|jgi:iron complex outermembrane receptor protein|uniref:TonB-dependent receptor domain-containing protein n=5 Tax=Sphingorhabdus sp. TaxID=1902408 RepID=UPI003BAFF9AF|nr:TonB-dependent receptor [Sphingomonadales bacterium]MBK9431435.1 TonB-dependent receptor [Sphingomonadales bacterium]